MKVKLSFILLVFITMTASQAAMQTPSILAERDAEFRSDTERLCNRVGEICSIFEQSCAKTRHRNICMYHSVYKAFVITGHCEGENYSTCMKDAGNYDTRLNAFMKSQDVAGKSSNSQLARMVLNKCAPFYYITPTQGHVIAMADRLKTLDSTYASVFDYKPLFECVQEQWMKQ